MRSNAVLINLDCSWESISPIAVRYAANHFVRNSDTKTVLPNRILGPTDRRDCLKSPTFGSLHWVYLQTTLRPILIQPGLISGAWMRLALKALELRRQAQRKELRGDGARNR